MKKKQNVVKVYMVETYSNGRSRKLKEGVDYEINGDTITFLPGSKKKKAARRFPVWVKYPTLPSKPRKKK